MIFQKDLWTTSLGFGPDTAKGILQLGARPCYRTSGCPPWSATPRVSCTPSSWTGSRKKCESPRPGSRGRTTSPGASGSTQSVTTCGCRHFDIENKYQPVKLTLFLVSFCRRGSKYLKGVFTLLSIEERSGCLAISRALFGIKYPNVPFYRR